MKVRDTVGNLIQHRDLQQRYGNVVLACAMELSDAVSTRVQRANETLARVDLDNEAEFDRCADELREAERVFLDIHGRTEVTL